MIQQTPVFTLISEPTYVADIDSLIANWVHQHYGRPEQSGQPESTADKKATVKRIWEALNNPDRPNDSVSVDRRIGGIGYLEELLPAKFSCTTDLRQQVERFLDSQDGRRLPVAKAIKRARKQARLSQLELAELLGLKDHTLISKYESGKRVPPLKVLEWLKKTENVTQKRPVKGSGRTPSNPVTSIRGNEAPISPNLGKSVTLPAQQECPSAVATATPAEDPAQGSLFPPADPAPDSAPLASPAEAPTPSTEEDPLV